MTSGGGAGGAGRGRLMERLVRALSRFAGSGWAHLLALVIVAAWVAVGPALLDWSRGYEALEQVIEGVAFLMLFALQRAQSKDTAALQLKLDELVASSPRASNRVLEVEDIPEEEMARIRRHFELLERLARSDVDLELTEEDARRRHEEERRFARDRLRAPGGGG